MTHTKCDQPTCDVETCMAYVMPRGPAFKLTTLPAAGVSFGPVPVDHPVTQRKKTPRGEVLFEAESLINGDRNNQYGPPTQDFDRTARLWTAEFEHLLKEGASFQGHHVALAMALLKISRLAWSPEKRDSWVDGAGYLACGFECAEHEGKATEDERAD